MTARVEAFEGPAHYFELDSLRGLAALTVVFHHLQFLRETDGQAPSLLLAPTSLVNASGPEAVLLFFVLSGFVLSLPAVNGRPQSYSTFLIRRVFRIYLPYLAAIAVSVAGACWLHGAITQSFWLNLSWSQWPSLRLVSQHIAFLGIYDTDQFDDPIWSLVHEMRISLVFPLLCGLVLRLKNGWSLVIAGGLTVTALVLGKRPLHVDFNLTDSIYFAALFVLGIVLARERSRLIAWFRNCGLLARALIAALFLWLYLLAFPELMRIRSGALHSAWYLAAQWVTAIGAAGLIVVCLASGWCSRILARPSIRFLGRVSYSLYLWHFVVLLYCVHLLYGKMPLAAILCLVLVLSIVVAWCSYRWIELPSIKLGRRLSNIGMAPSP